MSHAERLKGAGGAAIAAIVLACGIGLLAQGRGAGGPAGAPGGGQGRGNPGPDPIKLAPMNAMNSPYQLVLKWPHLGNIKAGGAIGIVPDGEGGTWMQHRSDPAIVHVNGAGDVIKTFDVTFATGHGLCRDRDGNFWAEDSGPFNDTPGVTGVKGNQLFKYSPEGKLLLTIGQPGVSKAGNDTFLQPVACVEAPDGNIIVADGHWPRPTVNPQDGDRLVWFTRDGKFIKAFGRHGRAPGEFMGPHGMAFDSQGRLFVADRSNNRVSIYDKDMAVVDNWTHFGRPSGVAILKDDTLIVADSESNQYIGGAEDAVEGGGNKIRNPGWKNGIRIGNAKDGSLKSFIGQYTRPEGLGADELGNIWGGLTGGCDSSESGGCLMKYVKKTASAAPKAAAAPAKKP
jgi:hypothetical protein